MLDEDDLKKIHSEVERLKTENPKLFEQVTRAGVVVFMHAKPLMDLFNELNKVNKNASKKLMIGTFQSILLSCTDSLDEAVIVARELVKVLEKTDQDLKK